MIEQVNSKLINDLNNHKMFFQPIDGGDKNQKLELVDIQPSGLLFDSGGGKKNFVDLPELSLVCYDGNELVVYEPGYRELNFYERDLLARWEEIASTDEYQKQQNFDRAYGGSRALYMMIDFFEKHYAVHLAGVKTSGRCLDWDRYETGNNLCVWDVSGKGEIICRYKVIFED